MKRQAESDTVIRTSAPVNHSYPALAVATMMDEKKSLDYSNAAVAHGALVGLSASFTFGAWLTGCAVLGSWCLWAAMEDAGHEHLLPIVALMLFHIVLLPAGVALLGVLAIVRRFTRRRWLRSRRMAAVAGVLFTILLGVLAIGCSSEPVLTAVGSPEAALAVFVACTVLSLVLASQWLLRNAETGSERAPTGDSAG